VATEEENALTTVLPYQAFLSLSAMHLVVDALQTDDHAGFHWLLLRKRLKPPAKSAIGRLRPTNHSPFSRSMASTSDITSTARCSSPTFRKLIARSRSADAR
jgi:hypothetical protein